MDYAECRRYIDDIQRFGRVLGLEGMRELLRRLGDPQGDLCYVHVAGTNGKGSVLAYVAHVLREAGYRTGRYTSPAIFGYREIMDVDGKIVSEEEFASVFSRVAEQADAMEREGLAHPTPFEMETAVAFLFFKEKGCEIVALETGMGGETDATNLVTDTKVAVLTSISLDHMDVLGTSIGEIAQCKAGIIKPGCRVVTTVQEPEAAQAIAQVCAEKSVPCMLADHREARVVSQDLHGQRFSYEGEMYSTRLSGGCQVENAVVAIKVLEGLADQGFKISRQHIREGLAKTAWPGRFTLIREEPVVILDGAHNPKAAAQLADSVKKCFAGKRIIYVMGMFKDKDYVQVAQITVPLAEEVITVETPGDPRALPAGELAEIVGRSCPRVSVAASLKEAASLSLEKAGADGVVVVFGSLSFLGEISGFYTDGGEQDNGRSSGIA